jgi:hypothetical protein
MDVRPAPCIDLELVAGYPVFTVSTVSYCLVLKLHFVLYCLKFKLCSEEVKTEGASCIVLLKLHSVICSFLTAFTILKHVSYCFNLDHCYSVKLITRTDY